jgi:diphthine synthase
MLFLIGLGLSRDDITLAALDACRGCSSLHVDRHTGRVETAALDYIFGETGKRASDLTRQEMEEGSTELIRAASEKDIAVLCAGDPLMATTHKILLIEAARQNVNARIVHSNSIITAAIGESGLDFYRFGKVCTIPRWSPNYRPVSFYETIHANLTNDAHTLLLLDYDAKTGSTISLKEAVSTLEEAEKSYKKGLIRDDSYIIVLHNISAKDSRLMHVRIREAKGMDIGGMNALIMHSGLSDIEKEALEALVST